MPKQSLNTDGFEKYRNPISNKIFLKDLDKIIPWKELCQMIEHYYPMLKGAGCRPVPLLIWSYQKSDYYELHKHCVSRIWSFMNKSSSSIV